MLGSSLIPFFYWIRPYWGLLDQHYRLRRGLQGITRMGPLTSLSFWEPLDGDIRNGNGNGDHEVAMHVDKPMMPPSTVSYPDGSHLDQYFLLWPSNSLAGVFFITLPLRTFICKSGVQPPSCSKELEETFLVGWAWYQFNICTGVWIFGLGHKNTSSLPWFTVKTGKYTFKSR